MEAHEITALVLGVSSALGLGLAVRKKRTGRILPKLGSARFKAYLSLRTGAPDEDSKDEREP